MPSGQWRAPRVMTGDVFIPTLRAAMGAGVGYDCFALHAMSLRDDVSLFGRMWRRRPAFARKSADVSRV